MKFSSIRGFKFCVKLRSPAWARRLAFGLARTRPAAPRLRRRACRGTVTGTAVPGPCTVGLSPASLSSGDRDRRGGPRIWSRYGRLLICPVQVPAWGPGPGPNRRHWPRSRRGSGGASSFNLASWQKCRWHRDSCGRSGRNRRPEFAASSINSGLTWRLGFLPTACRAELRLSHCRAGGMVALWSIWKSDTVTLRKSG